MSRKRKSIFQDLVEKPGSTRKWMFVPLSLGFHGLIVAAVMIMPLMNVAEAEFPQVKSISVFLSGVVAPPPPPPPPPAAPQRRRAQQQETRPSEETAPTPVNSGRLVQPIEIPEDIPEIPGSGLEGFVEGGILGGVEGGVEGGVVGGVIGGALLGNDDAGLQEPMAISSVQMPRLIKKVAPIYPMPALKARIQGYVVVEAITDISGKVIKARVITGHPLLRTAAEMAVRKWVYEPYIVNGNPRPVVFSVTVTFSLSN